MKNRQRFYTLLWTGLMLITPVVSVLGSAQDVAASDANVAQIAPRTAADTDYQKAMVAGVQQLLNNDQPDAWSALAAVQSGVPLSAAQRLRYHNALVADAQSMLADQHFSATDLEKLAIGVVALGEDATNFAGLNVVDKIIEKAPTSGINGQVYGIIALSMRDYGAKAQQAIDSLIPVVLKAQNAENGWALFGSKSDLDMTGMTMTALGMHRDFPGVQAALDKAVTMLKAKAFVAQTGGFLIPSVYMTEENSNSTAMVIMGLIAAGVDPMTAFVGDQGANPISRLVAYQRADGQFRWKIDNDMGSLAMSTEQAVYTLAQYRLFQAGKGSIYDFKTPIIEKAPVTVQAVDENGQVLKRVQLADQTVGQTITVNANQVAVDGYQLLGDAQQTVQVAKAGTTVTFQYRKQTVVQFADVQVQAVDENGQVLKVVYLKHQRVGLSLVVNATEVAVDGYQLKDTPTKVLSINEANNTISFKFAQPVVTTNHENQQQLNRKNKTQKTAKQLPQTGVMSTGTPMVGGLLLIGAGGIWFKRRMA
ncbi:LPXTG cell wall anchor domain-containing protein [Lactobacillus curvatus]|nr:LPXTG cell wall anchor domain-containing protein [Latilactobacillus curvatus]MSE24103.1 LPXTG cell wall anchor domain-containing protein [Latilactobacillus curvatus]